jgi:hypothetical protein
MTAQFQAREFWRAVKRFLPTFRVAAPDVAFKADVTTGAPRLVRLQNKKPGPVDYLKRGLSAFSLKWAAISFVLTAIVFFMISMSSTDTLAYEQALESQARSGDWSGGLQSLFVLRTVASPRPLEFLIMLIIAPILWNALPPRWRFIIFPIIAQMMYMLLSQFAFLPLEFALLNLFSSVADSLKAL